MALGAIRIAELNEAATRFYEEQLQTPAGRAALDYARSRGLSDETIRRWRLGYAPASGQALAQELARADWGETALLEAGLLRSGSRGSSDVFRDRLMLPIIDVDDQRVVGFGSRRLRDDDPTVPKYLNSPETALFHKSETLYGLPNLVDAKVSDEIYVVEGNLDMLALYTAGIRNVVAACGTALTAEHLHLLAQRVRRVTLVLDADAAGQAATARSLVLDGSELVDLGVLRITGAKDPAELLASGGLAAWQAVVASRIGRWEWLWAHLDARYPGSDAEERIERKDAWVELVTAQADGDEREALFTMAESALGIPDGLLGKEHPLDPASRRSATDELLLVALAAHFEERVRLLPYLPLGPGARAMAERWSRAGAASLGAKLGHRARSEGESAEQLWAMILRGEVGVRIRDEIAGSVGDQAKSSALTALLSIR